jgi:hypothetical protein
MSRRRCCCCQRFSEHFTNDNWQTAYDYPPEDPWSQSDTYLTVTDDTGTLTSKKEHPNTMWTFGLWADVPNFDPEDPDTYSFADYELRVKLKDENNYIFLQVTWDGLYSYEDDEDPPVTHYFRQWTMQLFERIDGSNTAISDAITYSADVGGALPLCLRYITICVDPWAIEDDYYGSATEDKYEVRSAVWDAVPNIEGNPFLLGNSPTYPLRGDTSQTAAFGDKHGLHVDTGVIPSGVDLIQSHEYRDDCRVCGCFACKHGTSPEIIEVTIDRLPDKAFYDDVLPPTELGNFSDLNGKTARLYRGRQYDAEDPAAEPTDAFRGSVCTYWGPWTSEDMPDWAGKGITLTYTTNGSVSISLVIDISSDPKYWAIYGLSGAAVLVTPPAKVDCYEVTDGLIVDVDISQSGVADPYSTNRPCYSDDGTLVVDDSRVLGWDGFSWLNVEAGQTLTLTYGTPLQTVVVTVVSVTDIGGDQVSIETEEDLPGDFPTDIFGGASATYQIPKGKATLQVIE